MHLPRRRPWSGRGVRTRRRRMPPWVSAVVMALAVALLGAVAVAGSGRLTPAARSTAEDAAPRAQQPDEVDPAEVDAFLREQVERHQLPGLAVVVIEEGRVTGAYGYGSAGDRPMGPTTPVPVGSLAETFTAVLVLQLAERGEVDLGAEVRTYLPDEPPPTGTATVRDLLQRTGHTADVGVATVVADPGYATLVRLVEAVTGGRYAEVLTDRVLGPLGMEATTADAEERAGAAPGHVKAFGVAAGTEAPGRLGDPGGGEVVSTAQDLAALAVALGMESGPRVLGPDALAQMREPGEPDTDGYGMGWEWVEFRREPVAGSRGLAPTTFTQLYVLPGLRSGYVLTVTSDHLLDRLVAMPQLRSGMLDLLTGREPAVDGPATRTVGRVVLAMLVVTVLLQGWSYLGLRGWRRRARHLTRGGVVRHVAPHVVFPVLVLLLSRPLVPQLLGEPGAELWELARYQFPDVALLVVLAVVPDLVKAAYMVVTAVRARRSRLPRWARLT